MCELDRHESDTVHKRTGCVLGEPELGLEVELSQDRGVHQGWGMPFSPSLAWVSAAFRADGHEGLSWMSNPRTMATGAQEHSDELPGMHLVCTEIEDSHPVVALVHTDCIVLPVLVL